MIRLAVKIAYRGKDFCGSQIQPDVRTVEGDILSDIGRITKLPTDSLDLHLASRTDRGVNALGNVASFNSNMDPEILLKALNSTSEKIFYLSYALVGEDFNPRHASRRMYRYIMPSRGLDISLVKECVALFVGENDFKRFCKSEGKPTIITIDSIDLIVDDDDLILEFSARFYLWNMIRRIAAATISVGCGNSSLSDVRDALSGKDMTFGLARADALTLTDILYDNIHFKIPKETGMTPRIEEERFLCTLNEHFNRSL